MTGRFAIRSGTQSVPVGVPYYGLIPWEETMAERLKSVGYATAIFGKWHLGKTQGRFPTDQGFDQWYGIQDSSGDAVRWSDWMERFSIREDFEQALPEEEYPWIKQAKAGEKPTKVKKFDLDAKRSIDGELTDMAIDYITQKPIITSHFLPMCHLPPCIFPLCPVKNLRASRVMVFTPIS